MDYSKWEEKQLAVSSILLDEKNPRIPPTIEPLNQRLLIDDLITHDKVYELAQNIVQNGYYPVESLIVIKEDARIVVIEGNRRLAALKLLITPEAAPEGQVARFRALSSRVDKTTIKKVKVIIAPDRQAAAPIIMSRHTNVQIERWEPIQQASYYTNLLQNGITIDDLSHQYNISKMDIIQSLRLYKMYQVACHLDLPDEIGQIVRNPREFKATTLQRFYERPISQQFLGIQLSRDSADILGTIDEAEFKKGYRKAVIDIARGSQDSRSLGTTAQVKKYISTFSAEERPDLTKKGKFTADTLIAGKGKGAEDLGTKQSAPTKRLKRKPTGLIPRHISCDVNNQRVNDTFNELRTLPVAKYPNATAVLFRSLLEMALSHYLEVSGELYSIIDEEKEKVTKEGQKMKKDWHPSLKRMLRHITGPKCNLIQNPNMKRALDKFTNQKEEFLSHDDLNFFVHNQYYSPNEEVLRSFWGQLEGLFQIILVEPDSK